MNNSGITHKECIVDRLLLSAQTVLKMAENDEIQKHIELAAKIIQDSLALGGKLLICGNGGSAADAQHMAAELVGRFKENRQGLMAIALTTDTSVLTAISNDFGYENIFSRQIEALGRRDDVLLAISTSGRSVNIIKALETAVNCEMTIIVLTGDDPGWQLSRGGFANVCIKVPSKETDLIQQAHLVIEHIICGLVEHGIKP